MSPPADEPNDRDAILARRAIFLSTALAALHCGPRDQPVDPPATSSTAATASAHPSATARSPVPALRPFQEVKEKAPPRELPAELDEQEKAQLGALDGKLSAQLAAIEKLWTNIPGCDAADPGCRQSWRDAGDRLREIYDNTRSRGFGGCGGAVGRTASVASRQAAHQAYVEALVQELEAHMIAVAQSFTPQGEQAWRKLEANAKKPPPMPCLSPCAMPEVNELSQSVSFAKNESKLDAQLSKSALDAVVASYKSNTKPSRIVVRGHASPNETNPEELAKARAKVVAEHLVQAGVPKDKVTTKSFGSSYRIGDPQRFTHERVDFQAAR